MEAFWKDVRHALRMLRRSPGFTLAALLTLTLGIGANAAVFSVVNSVLLRPLPYAEPGRLVLLSTNNKTFGPGIWPVSYPNFVDYREQNRALEAMAVTRNVTYNMTDSEQTERVEGARVSAGLLRLLGLRPFLGRDFAEEEEKPGASPVMMASYGLWQRRFGGDPALLGRNIQLDGLSYTVVGILPPQLAYPSPNADFWIPLIPGTPESIRGNYFLRAVARVRIGVSLGEADAQMKAIAVRLEKEYPQPNNGASIDVLPLHDAMVGDVRPALWVLFGAVGLVLLIACANIANLLLARSSGRTAELAIRTALGAGRIRLVRQMLTESLLLSLMGGALGLALAVTGVPALTRISAGSIPRAHEIQLDARVLLFTLGLTLITALLFGLLPALRQTRGAATASLREAGRRGATRGAGHRRALGALVVTEVALTLVLLAGAGLLFRSFLRLQSVSPGFEPAGLLTFEMGVAGARYSTLADQAEFYRKVVERISTVPGVESAAAVHRLPMFRFPTTTAFQIEGRPVPPGAIAPAADVRIITPDYFRALKIPLRAGRELTDRDDASATKVVVISQAVANQHWPGESPVGKRIQIGANQTDLWEIVGVVGDVRMRGLDKEAGPAVYWTMQQNFFPTALRSVTLLIRTRTEPAALVSAVRRTLREVDPQEGLAAVRTMEAVVAESYAQRRLNLTLMLVFASVATLLAVVGLYGVMSYSVTQCRQEIGIRMALGAQARDVLRMVVAEGMWLAGIGLVIGLGGALALTRTIQSLLFGTSASDPATLAAVSLLLAVVVFLASYFPARRAARTDPLIALRYE